MIEWERVVMFPAKRDEMARGRSRLLARRWAMDPGACDPRDLLAGFRAVVRWFAVRTAAR